MTGLIVATLLIALPFLAFTAWPLVRRGRGRVLLPVPPDARAELTEQKRSLLRALRELEFEHSAGHVSEDDYTDLRARYELETARLLAELDRLGPAPAPVPAATPRTAAASTPAARRTGWQHPVALATSALVLVVFGAALGVGIVRYTEPDPNAGIPLPGSRPLAVMPPAADAGTGASGSGTSGAIDPGMLQGMLAAARESLFAGRYGEAIAAYQAILKRDATNVDAMTHLGLIVAIGGHADSALETFDRALAIDPEYPPALLYRGQLLYEVKNDVTGAISSWERFVAVSPPGEERDRVSKLLADARQRRNGGR